MLRSAFGLVAAVLSAAAPPELKVKLGEAAPEVQPAGVQKVLVFSASKPPALDGIAKQLAAKGTKVIHLDTVERTKFLNGGGDWALLIDREGKLRRVEPAISDLAAMVRRWETGKSIFSIACTRCHGDDGNSADFYAYNIRPLGGIGNRLSEDEILQRLHPLRISGDQYSVRAYLLSEEELRSLVSFLAGL